MADQYLSTHWWWVKGGCIIKKRGSNWEKYGTAQIYWLTSLLSCFRADSALLSLKDEHDKINVRFYFLSPLLSLLPTRLLATIQSSAIVQLCLLITLTNVKTPKYTELVIQSNKNGNSSLPSGFRRGECNGGGGESGVERGEHFGDSLASVRALQNHPSSLFL